MKICFFARVQDKRLFDVVEFYKVDINALRSLGHEVVLVNSFRSLLTTKCDSYFIWWFGYGVFPVLLAKMRGVPSVLTGAVHTSECGSLVNWPFHKRVLMQISMKLADRTLFISKTDFLKLGNFQASAPSIVYCAVDLTKYFPTAVDRKKIILTVSHLTHDNVRRKMLKESLQAFSIFVKTNRDFIYHICGSFGDAVDDIRKLILDYGIEANVVLRGRVSDEEKIQLLQTAWIYLQPSICEGFGLAILEAKACGLPVVTSREPCIVEINDDSVVYGDTVTELANGMLRLVDDGEFYENLRFKGLENVKNYSSESRLIKLKAILESF